MGPRGRRLSLIIPVIIAVLIFGDFLKIIDDYVEWGDKVWTSFLSLWAREIDVDISVVDPPGIPITVKVRAGNKDIAQKSATSGPNPVTFHLPSTRTYSITVTSEKTNPISRDFPTEGSTGPQQCTVKLAWTGDRRPYEVQDFKCGSSTTAEATQGSFERRIDPLEECPNSTTAEPKQDSFEHRVDRLEERLVASWLVLMQTQFETGSADPGKAFGLAVFRDDPIDLMFGELLWSLRGHTLQPMLRHMRQRAPDAFRDAFGPGDAFLAEVAGRPCDQSNQPPDRLRAAFSGTFDMVWKPRFDRLSADPRIQDLEAHEARQQLSMAVKAADCLYLHSKRALAVLFSIIVTSGPIHSQLWQNFKPVDADERLRLAAFLQTIRSQSGDIWRAISQRLPILLGEAEPHAPGLDLSRFEPPGEPSACPQQAG